MTQAPNKFETVEDEEKEEFSGTITFLPLAKSGRTRMLQVSMRQDELMDVFLSTIPSLSVNRIIPSDSLVFNVVEEGRLMELRQLLGNGTASLRDHDEDGRSLLFVKPLRTQ